MKDAIIFPFLMTMAEATKRKEKQLKQQQKPTQAENEQNNSKTQTYLENYFYWKVSRDAVPTLVEHLTH